MMDMVALGELLIDFTDAGRSDAGMRLFEQNPGGAPANVACCAAALGLKTAFIGKVGTDMHGAYLKTVLDERGVCTDGLIRTESCFTTLAFVSVGQSGERTFSFARKPGADTTLRPDELNRTLLLHTRVLSVGSLSLTHEPARSATWEAIETAKSAGALIAYDPNYRAALWSSRQAAVEQMRSVLQAADIVKLSEEETELLTGVSDPEAALVRLTRGGVQMAAVTLGANGALVRAGGETRRVPGFPCDAVDTTGAGDAFFGGFLSAFLRSGRSLQTVTAAEAAEFARFANAAAACCVQKRGAIPAMPDQEAVLSMLR